MVLEKNPKTRLILKRLLQAEDRLKGKPFPCMTRVKQISIYACGPATLEMLFSFLGVKVSQTSLIRSIRAWNKIKLYGIDVNDMAKAAGIAGKKKYSFWRKQYASTNDLNRVVNKYKYPVGVEWQGVFYEHEDEDSGHYGVVTKVDITDADKKVGLPAARLPAGQGRQGFLRIADPFFNGYFRYNGIDRKFKIAEFRKKWWDINEIKIAGRIKTRKIKDTRMMFLITPKGETWPKKLRMIKAS